ncbi:MAG: hypothetical protein AB9921_02395 [Erysipelotrichaceae bacterium]
MIKKLFAISLSLALIMTMLVYAFVSKMRDSVASAKSVYAMVSVDINPSFEFYTDYHDIVVEIKALNDDALTLDVSGLVGLSIEEAIEKLIVIATEAGFIVSADTSDDYVIVTTVILDEEEEDDEAEEEIKQDSLGQRIQAAVAASAGIEDTTVVAVIKATLREKFEAEGKNVPLGLYVINGMVEVEGEWLSVSEFVASQKNVDQLEKKAQQVIRKQDRFTSLCEKFISALEGVGVDTAQYVTRLATEGEDLEALKDELEALWATYDIEEEVKEENVKPEKEKTNNGKGDSKINTDDEDEDDIESA